MQQRYNQRRDASDSFYKRESGATSVSTITGVIRCVLNASVLGVLQPLHWLTVSNRIRSIAKALIAELADGVLRNLLMLIRMPLLIRCLVCRWVVSSMLAAWSLSPKSGTLPKTMIDRLALILNASYCWNTPYP